MSAADKPADHPRVPALIEQYRHADAGMQDLPIYNPKISIEAIGFRFFRGNALLGVLLTPWFMNLMPRPIQPVPMEIAAIGRSVLVELPAGKRTFTTGGDEVIGLYKAHSLHAPVLVFALPGQAGAQARRALAAVLTPAAAESEVSNRPRASGIDRRPFLFRSRDA